MFNLEQHIINNADSFVTFYDRFTGQYLCDGYVIEDVCFLFDDDGIIDGAMFTIEGSGIRSYRSRVNAGNAMGLDASEIYVSL